MLKKVMVILLLVFVVVSNSYAAEIFTYPDGNVQMTLGVGEIASGIIASGLLDVSSINIYFVYQNAYTGSFDAMIFFRYVSTNSKKRTITWRLSGTENGRSWIDLGLQSINY